MAFTPPPPPPEIRAEGEDAARWSALLLWHAAAQGAQAIRVQRRNDAVEGGGPWYYIAAPTAHTFHLRCVQGAQLVFDIGDDEVTADSRVATPWEVTAAWTEAIWDACAALGVPYHGGLSGGKGAHTEVWLEPHSQSRMDMVGACANCLHPDLGGQGHCLAMVGLDGDVRCHCRTFSPHRAEPGSGRKWHIANRIVAEAHRILRERGDAEPRIRFDPRLISPATDSRQCREWGQRKTAGAPRRKILWHEGCGMAPRLPREQSEAYKMGEAIVKLRGRVRPEAIPVAANADAWDTQWILDLNGAKSYCPKGPQCLTPEGGWATCDGCPSMGMD